MNVFGFIFGDAFLALFSYLLYGTFFGFIIMGIARFILFTAIERKEA